MFVSNTHLNANLMLQCRQQYFTISYKVARNVTEQNAWLQART